LLSAGENEKIIKKNEIQVEKLNMFSYICNSLFKSLKHNLSVANFYTKVITIFNVNQFRYDS
jgi:hypothetical protein